jgi:hypothetical protein
VWQKAGHPAGTAFVLAAQPLIEDSGLSTTVNFEEGVGTITVTVEWQNGLGSNEPAAAGLWLTLTYIVDGPVKIMGACRRSAFASRYLPSAALS